MSNTQLALKFKNGDVVTHNDFGSLIRLTGGEDLITVIEGWKRDDAPIILKGDGGVTYESSGSELLSVEIIL